MHGWRMSTRDSWLPNVRMAGCNGKAAKRRELWRPLVLDETTWKDYSARWKEVNASDQRGSARNQSAALEGRAEQRGRYKSAGGRESQYGAGAGESTPSDGRGSSGTAADFLRRHSEGQSGNVEDAHDGDARTIKGEGKEARTWTTFEELHPRSGCSGGLRRGPEEW
jgi:hypothetical protein